MENPIGELNKKMSYTEMSDKTGYSKQYMQILGKYDMEKMGTLPLSTLTKLEKSLGLDLINKLK